MSDQSTTAKPETRDRIVEAARSLFFEQGYNATGIAQILQASEANSGSLYHFFPTKEDLLIAVLERYRTMLQTHVIGPAYERVSDPIERVFAILDGYRRLLGATGFRLGCPIGNLAIELSNSHPRVRELTVQNFRDWSTAVAATIESAAGRLPPGTNPQALANYVLATMEGAVLLARAYQSFQPFDDAIQQVREHFDGLISQGTDWSAPKRAQGDEQCSDGL